MTTIAWPHERRGESATLCSTIVTGQARLQGLDEATKSSAASDEQVNDERRADKRVSDR